MHALRTVPTSTSCAGIYFALMREKSVSEANRKRVSEIHRRTTQLSYS
jgi:hypothetical protein